LEVLGLILTILCWGIITVQLICSISFIKVWMQIKLKPLLWFSMYIGFEFGRSFIGYSMGKMRIHNREFYWYSAQFAATALFIFALTLIQDKKLRKYISIAFGLIFSTFIILEILQTSIENRHIIVLLELFQITVGTFILRDRLQHHNSSNFGEDPWAIIAFVILSTVSISLLANICFSFANSNIYYNHLNSFYQPLLMFFNYLNCISVLVRYILISKQLKKFKNLSLS
jgi:hypothetical protein